MLDPESPAVGVTDGTPAPASVIADAAVPTTDGQQAEPSTATVAVDEPEGAATGDGTDELADAPEQSSPEQRSRWGKLRDREAAAQAKASELEEKYAPFAAVEPVREHVLGIVAGLTADFSDPAGYEKHSEAVLNHMFEIDPEGTPAVTGYVLEKWGHLRDERVYGATPDEIRQGLELLRSGGQRTAPIEAVATASLPPALADEWELMSPEAQAALSDLLTRQSEGEKAKAQTSEQEMAARAERARIEQEERKAVYRQTLVPFIQEKVVAWGVTDPEAQSDFWNAVAGSISNSPSDLKAIQTAESHAAAGRLYAATSTNEAVKAVYEKHIGLVGSRLLKQKQAEAAAAGDAAATRANGKNAPDHIPGSAAPPSVGSGWNRKTMTLEQRLAWIRENGPPPE